jgi:hypothetical protein
VVDESCRVENFHNGSELTRELKIRRLLLPSEFNFLSLAHNLLFADNPPRGAVSLPITPLVTIWTSWLAVLAAQGYFASSCHESETQ